jgi:hypothetical protein
MFIKLLNAVSIAATKSTTYSCPCQATTNCLLCFCGHYWMDRRTSDQRQTNTYACMRLTSWPTQPDLCRVCTLVVQAYVYVPRSIGGVCVATETGSHGYAIHPHPSRSMISLRDSIGEFARTLSLAKWCWYGACARPGHAEAELRSCLGIPCGLRGFKTMSFIWIYQIK